MGRTKKRHRAWKKQMRSRARKRRDWGFSWGDISPGPIGSLGGTGKEGQAWSNEQQE